MENEERALLEEIAEHPDDDIPRLVYADWLEERGNPRADFIRAQCELERPLPELRFQEIRELERRLLQQHESEWTLGLNRDQVTYLRFRRGFIDTVQTTWQYFRKVVAPRRILWPVRTLALSIDGSGDLQSWKSMKELSQIRTLKFSGQKLGAKGMRLLCRCEHLTSLRELYLTACYVNPHCLELLIQAPFFAGLRNLMIGGNQLGDEGASLFAESSLSQRLEILGVAYSGIEDAGAIALVTSASLQRLSVLRFGGNHVSDDTLRRMRTRFENGLVLL